MLSVDADYSHAISKGHLASGYTKWVHPLPIAGDAVAPMGVYMIRNRAKNKVYVGSAANIKKRWHEHHHALKHNRHKNSRLQAAWNECGTAAFAWEILELVSSAAALKTAEQAWLDAFQVTDERYGYNFHADATGKDGLPCPQERKTRISKTLQEFANTPEQKLTLSQQARDAWQNPKFRAAQEKRLHKFRTDTDWQKRQASNACRYVFIVTAPDGSEQRVINLTQFCRENELTAPAMYQMARGDRPGKARANTHHKGWKCRKDGGINGDL